MNFYNPYYFPVARPSLFGTLRNSINFSSILNGTQRTLNIINQAIPLVKQVSPVMKNARTMFRVMNEFKKVGGNNLPNNTLNNSSAIEKKTDNSTNYEEGPKFFV